MGGGGGGGEGRRGGGGGREGGVVERRGGGGDLLGGLVIMTNVVVVIILLMISTDACASVGIRICCCFLAFVIIVTVFWSFCHCYCFLVILSFLLFSGHFVILTVFWSFCHSYCFLVIFSLLLSIFRRLLADTALEKLDLDLAERAFVNSQDFGGIQFVKKLRKLRVCITSITVVWSFSSRIIFWSTPDVRDGECMGTMGCVSPPNHLYTGCSRTILLCSFIPFLSWHSFWTLLSTNIKEWLLCMCVGGA